MSNELEQALFAKLTAATALTSLLAGTAAVYNQQAPRGSDYDFVIFQYQGGGDENKSPHRAQNVLYAVKGVSNTSLKTAGLIDAQIDAVLHMQELSVSGWATNHWLAREDNIRFVETTPEGDDYYHAGGVYRVRIAQ